MNAPFVFRHTLRSHRGGFAIVIVLSVLFLLTVLVVGFLGRSQAERASSASYFDGTSTSILADYAVDLVQAQIDHASSRKQTAWASQPGMVRTFKPDGSLLNAYKLYSDSEMIASTVDVAATRTALDNWDKYKAVFVDLNAPVFLNPDNAADKKPVYPIIDASSAGGDIKGFEVRNAPQSTADQPIPMPVKWLYILRDGTTVAPDAPPGDSNEIKTATIPGATASNPIVGRIAFWTDDETAKLNINTAGHGSFWDIPRAYSLEERDRLARFQPALNEFQRYPGHPATTSLWPVLGYKFPGDDTVRDSKGNYLFPDFSNFVYKLVPRVEEGGSKGGTTIAAQPVTLDGERLFSSVEELLFDAHGGNRTASAGLTQADIEKTKFFLTARSNAPEVNLFNLPRMAIWPINAGSKKPSTIDQLIAFCGTINNQPYYFQREDSQSSTHDVDSGNAQGRRNLDLYNYITHLLSLPHPGFSSGGDTFASKYTADETGQIVTEIFDYIRSSNLYSTSFGADAYTAGNINDAGSMVGQVAPLKIGDTKGVGRLPVLSKAIFQLFISGAESQPAGHFSPLKGKTPGYNANDPAYKPFYTPFYSFLNLTTDAYPVTLKTSGVLYFDTFDPMYGYTFPRYNFQIDVEFKGAWTVNGQSVGFPSTAQLNINHDHQNVYDAKIDASNGIWMGRALGGLLGPHWMMQNYSSISPNPPKTSGDTFNGPYPLVGGQMVLHDSFYLIKRNNANLADPADAKWTLPPSTSPSFAGKTIDFSGGTAIARLKVGSQVVQEYTFEFPQFTKPVPIYADREIPLDAVANPGDDLKADKVLKQFVVSADFRNRWLSQPMAHRANTPGPTGNTQYPYGDLGLIQEGDVAVALEARFGDKRLLAGRSTLTSTGADASFEPNASYSDGTRRRAVSLRTDPHGEERRNWATRNGIRTGRILNIAYGTNAMPDIPDLYSNGVQTTTKGIGGVTFPPDFDNGTLHMPDDAYVGRADEGSVYDNLTTTSVNFAWYNYNLSLQAGSYNTPTFYSPNRQMPSAVKFGSLPTGVVQNHPWQTLLFRPDPGGHPGASSVPDHILLDLFWMPVVEPYAISEPFSTNGKVNMNYQIMPFNYIHRSSAIRGALQSEEILVLENNDARDQPENAQGYAGNASNVDYKVRMGDEYKRFDIGNTAGTSYLSTKTFRHRLNFDEGTGTLKGFEERFSRNDIFRSESEICGLSLVPEGETWDNNFESTYWGTRRLTGDNSREAPYANLLPKLTTRSNTYTVHYRIQSLKKTASSAPNVWEEGRDVVASEARGSRVVERYIDPNNRDIPDYAASPSPENLSSLERFYRWRVIANREFSP